MMIVTAGMIGAGKSTLTTEIAKTFNTEPFYEEVDNNPILDKFYEDPKRWAFSLQIYFLNKRFKAIKQALSHDNNVLDRSIYEDALFTKINNQQGNISDIDMNIYNELLSNMMEELQGLPKKAPDLLVYLEADFETILEHIKHRGRDYEQWDNDPALLEYYRTLWEQYEQWYEDYNYSPKMKIKVEDYHPDDEESLNKVMNDIANKLYDIRFSNNKCVIKIDERHSAKESSCQRLDENCVRVQHFDQVEYMNIIEFIRRAKVVK